MDRILIIIIMCLISACRIEQTSDERKIILTEISNGSRYYEYNLMPQVEKFVEMNHQRSPCSDEILEQIYTMYNMLDSIQSKLVEFSGGYDNNGKLINADNIEITARLIRESALLERLDLQFKRLKELSDVNDAKMAGLVVEKVGKDIRIFSFPSYSIDGLMNLSVIQFYNDLVLTKSSLLFSEFMYFEILKSTGC